eukprot:gene1166-1182_t
MSNQQIKGHLEAMVLAILEEGPAHGYSIIESLRKNSSGLFDLPEGTVYPALHRLEEAGLVKSTREFVDGRERRVYQIVTAGQSTLKESRAAWQAFSSAVSRILVTTNRRKRGILNEVRDHLLDSTAQKISLGAPTSLAEDEAINAFGSADLIARGLNACEGARAAKEAPLIALSTGATKSLFSSELFPHNLHSHLDSVEPLARYLFGGL